MSAIRNRAKLEARIGATVDRVAAAMDLGWLEIQVRYDEGGDRETVAKSQCDWKYRRIVISWTLSEVAPMGDDELELVAIHELCHALIEPLWDSHPGKEKRHVVNLGELVTENVARVVQALIANP